MREVDPPPLLESFDSFKDKVVSAEESNNWDAGLYSLLDLINSSSSHVSQSSCSGRIVVYCQRDDDPEPDTSIAELDEDQGDEVDGLNEEPLESDLESLEGMGRGAGKARSETINGKDGGSFLYSSHVVQEVPVEEHEVLNLLFAGSEILPYEDTAPLTNLEEIADQKVTKGGIVSLKFEAMVLNVTSKSLSDCVPLLQLALATGHRSSGIVFPSLRSIAVDSIEDSSSDLHKEDYSNLPVTLEIRTSSMSFGSPIARRVFLNPTRTAMGNWLKNPSLPKPVPTVAYQLLVAPSYLSFLLRQANLRMDTNARRTEKLYQAFDSHLTEGRGREGREERRVERVSVEKSRADTQNLVDEQRREFCKAELIQTERLRAGVGSIGDWLQEVRAVQGDKEEAIQVEIVEESK